MLTRKVELLDGAWVQLKKPSYKDVLSINEIVGRQNRGDLKDDVEIFDFLAPFLVSWSYEEPVSREALELIDYQNAVSMFYAIVALCKIPEELLKNFATL